MTNGPTISEEDSTHPSRLRSECARFVESVLPELGDLFHEAETALHEIPFRTLTLLRGCAKLVALELYSKHGISADNGRELGKLLNDTAFKHVTQEKLQHDLHKIRIAGNRAAHPEDGRLERPEAAKLAKVGLEKLYALVVEHLAPDPEEAPTFELPDEGSSNRLCGDAVLRDDAEAQFSLGMLKKREAEEAIEATHERDGDYFDLLMAGRPFEEAYYWFERAGRDDRYPQAIYELSQLQIGGCVDDWDVDRGLVLLYQADELGVVDAAATLGLYALTGDVFDSNGRTIAAFELDEPAKERLEYAASHGHPGALNGLMTMYLEGREVTQNHKRAVEYARAAADMGFPVAKLNLARLYLDDIGDPREEGEVVKLLEDAIEAGIQAAFINLYHVYDEGIGVEADPERAAEALERGCEAMEPYALVAWSQKSIVEDGPERELKRELYSLLRVIDNNAAPEELRVEAEGLLERTIEAMREDCARGLSQRGEVSGARAEELEHYLMDLGVATAEPDRSQPVSPVVGFASNRSLFGLRVRTAFLQLVAPGLSMRERKEAISILEDVIPGFDWMSLAPERGMSRRNYSMAALTASAPEPFKKRAPDVGRNAPCPCGTGKKYKRCCFPKE